MTTIFLAPASDRHPMHQVFGRYEDDDDRFVFAVQDFADLAEARLAAERLARKFDAGVTTIDG